MRKEAINVSGLEPPLGSSVGGCERSLPKAPVFFLRLKTSGSAKTVQYVLGAIRCMHPVGAEPASSLTGSSIVLGCRY
jgi:hypothetical protein